MKPKFLLIGLLGYWIIGLFANSPAVQGQEMSSENYKLQGGATEMTSGTTQNLDQNISLSDSVGSVNSSVFTSKGYLINPSLIFGEAISEFSLSTSSDRVIYDGLDMGKASSGKITIQAENGNNPGFNIFILENQPLSKEAGLSAGEAETQIPDTLCSKSFPCTVDQASPWTDPDVFGFGYRVDGKTSVPDFDTTSSFKPLPSQKRGQNSSLIMNSSSRKTTDEAILQLSVRPSKSQTKDKYRNIIHIIGIPGI